MLTEIVYIKNKSYNKSYITSHIQHTQGMQLSRQLVNLMGIH